MSFTGTCADKDPGLKEHLLAGQLNAAHAREKEIPKLLPRSPRPDHDLREEILAGLTLLLKENGDLPAYRKFLDRLKRSPTRDWMNP